MEAQGWSHEKKPRRKGRILPAGKQVLEFAALQVPSGADPVVQYLQGQLYVRRSLQFQNRKPAVSRDRKQVNDVAITPCERKHLTVQRLRQQGGIDENDIGADGGFEPSFRGGKPAGSVAGAVWGY